RLNEVGQDKPRSHGRQLIDIADQDNAGMRWHCPQKLIHQHHIDHRRLVYYEQIEIQRMRRISPEAAESWIEFEQAMDGLGLAAGRLAQPFSRATGRGAKGVALMSCRENLQDPANDGAFANAGAACND